MELIDKKQIAAFKRLGKRLGGEPARLRMTLCLVLAGVGIFGVERPLGLRLARARTAQGEARKLNQMAEEVAFFTRERAAYEARVSVPADITDWQNYVLERLRCTTATLISLEPRKPLSKGVFTVLEMELVAKGDSYLEFADFIDRVEHGERIIRVEKLRLEKQQASIYLTCLIRGLVKGGKSASKPAAARLKADSFVGPPLPEALARELGLEPAAAPPAEAHAEPAAETSDESQAEPAAERADEQAAEPDAAAQESAAGEARDD